MTEPVGASGRAPVKLGLLSLALVVTVSLGGQSPAVSPRLGPVLIHLSAGAAVALVWSAAAAGSASLLLSLRALRHGWRPQAGWLLVGSVVAVGALVSLAPVGTADIGSYASYGAQADSGLDPYVTHPQTRGGSFELVEAPWVGTPSVYGPVATAEMRVAAHLAGGPHDPYATVRWLQLEAGLAFLTAAGLLHWALRGDAAAQSRAAVLWAANPLLLLHLVSGGHVDALVALPVLAAVLLWRRLVAAVPLGLALATKATSLWAAAGLMVGGIVAGGVPEGVGGGLVALGAVAVAVPLYLLAGPHVLDQAHHAGRFVSAGTPWRWLASLGEHVTHAPGAVRTTIAAAAALGALALAIRLGRGRALVVDGGAGARAWAAPWAAAGVLGWLLLAPYQLPWYDAAGWVLLAVLVSGAADWVLAAHTIVLTLAYLPGRVVSEPAWVHVTQVGLRSVVAPIVVAGCVVAMWRRAGNLMGHAVPGTALPPPVTESS